MSKRLARVLIIVLVLILLSASVALAYYFFGLAKEPANLQESPTPEIAIPADTPVDKIHTVLPSSFSEITIEPSHPTVSPTSVESPTSKMTATQRSEPTEINSPTPSATLPPTKTPDPDVCSNVNIQFTRSTSNIALWQLNNMNYQPSAITRIELTWPKQNEALFNAFLEGNVIWSGGDLTSPTTVTEWIGSPSDRQVVGRTRLEFLFGTDVAPNGYEITVELDNGCSTNTSN